MSWAAPTGSGSCMCPSLRPSFPHPLHTRAHALGHTLIRPGSAATCCLEKLIHSQINTLSPLSQPFLKCLACTGLSSFTFAELLKMIIMKTPFLPWLQSTVSNVWKQPLSLPPWAWEVRPHMVTPATSSMYISLFHKTVCLLTCAHLSEPLAPSRR